MLRRRVSSETESIRVLHVDDDPSLTELAATFLQREREKLTVVSESSAVDGLERLATGAFDCVVSDYQMPGMDGLDFLERVRESSPDLPFILFTGKGSEEIASDAISGGVTDYLQKEVGTDQYTVLANRIVNSVERYRAERTLERSEASLSNAQRIANLGNWDWNVDAGDLYWSDQIFRIFGVDPADFDATYEGFLSFVHPEDRPRVQSAVDAALAGEEAYDLEHRIVRPDGTVRVVHERAEVEFDDDLEPRFMSGTVQDVTERRQRERELERSRTKYQVLLETAPNAVFVVELESREVVETNAAATRLLGRPREEILEMTQPELHPPGEAVRYAAFFEDHVESERTVFRTFADGSPLRVYTAAGERVPVEISAQVFELDDVPHVQGVFRDLRENGV